jgi:hypothetical protein
MIHVTFLMYYQYESFLTSTNSLRRRFGTDEAPYGTADEGRVQLFSREFGNSLTPLDQVAGIQLSVPSNVRFESRTSVDTIEHITGLRH